MLNVNFSSNKALDMDIIVRYFKNVFRASLDSSLQRCRFSFWSIVLRFFVSFRIRCWKDTMTEFRIQRQCFYIDGTLLRTVICCNDVHLPDNSIFLNFVYYWVLLLGQTFPIIVTTFRVIFVIHLVNTGTLGTN